MPVIDARPVAADLVVAAGQGCCWEAVIPELQHTLTGGVWWGQADAVSKTPRPLAGVVGLLEAVLALGGSPVPLAEEPRPRAPFRRRAIFVEDALVTGRHAYVGGVVAHSAAVAVGVEGALDAGALVAALQSNEPLALLVVVARHALVIKTPRSLGCGAVRVLQALDTLIGVRIA